MHFNHLPFLVSEVWIGVSVKGVRYMSWPVEVKLSVCNLRVGWLDGKVRIGGVNM